MRIDPALRALRSDPASQRRAREAMANAAARWRAREDWRGVVAGLKAYGSGAALEHCPELAVLFTAEGCARALVDEFVGHFTAALEAEPLGHVPVRCAVNGSVATLMLGKSGEAILSLVMFDGPTLAARPRAQSAGFHDGERHEIVLGGQGMGRLVKCAAAGPSQAAITVASCSLAADDVIRLQSASETLLVDEVAGRLVSLRLVRIPEKARPTREFALEGGALLHQAAGTARESSQEMMITLLARMGRKDAAPVMADIAQEGSDHLRWQALRECLVLDSATGFATLCEIASDTTDSLAGPAGVMRAQLLESYPELTSLVGLEEEATCPV